MFNRAAFENSRPDGFSVLEVVPEAEGPRRFVPLKRTELAGEVAGPLASLRLTQTYGYSREQCDRALEAVYRFPLPGDAAVTGVRVRFGDVEIEAELKERQAAEAEYQAAKAEGRQAALATRESPDVFTLQVAGLQPDEEIVVETRYVQLARAEGLEWGLRIPLTTSPRYVRADEEGSRAAAGQPLLLLRDPGHRFSLAVLVRGAASAKSPTHALAAEPTQDGLRVRLAEGEVLPDRDCLLRWQLPLEERRPSLRVLLHDESAAGQVYFLALVSPPAAPPPERVPREVVLLVDHSGSMQGPKWEAADWAVKRFLSDLTNADRFALGLFHNSTRWFEPAPRPGDPETVGRAVHFLEAHRDSGGTELGVALEKAVKLPRAEGERARYVLVITDAEVSDAARVLHLADAEAGERERRRISVLCIDAAPNAFLAHELAERGGGVARFLTSAPEEEDVTTALDEVLTDWSAPVLAGLRLEVDRPRAEGAGRMVRRGVQAGWSAVDLGDLPAGRALWVVGRAQRGESATLHFRLVAGDGSELATRRPVLAAGEAEQPAIKALFGARQVLALEFLRSGGYGLDLDDQLRRLGYDPSVVLDRKAAGNAALYPENRGAEEQEPLRLFLAREALNYGLASAETAFVATRKEAGRPVEGTVAVANALPAGWSEEFHAQPAGAMGALYCSMPAPAAGGGAIRACRTHALGFRPQPMGLSPLGGYVSEDAPRQAAGTHVVLFSGTPDFRNGEAVLFEGDSGAGGGQLSGEVTLKSLAIDFPGGAPASAGAELVLLLFVEDLAAPRARIRIADLLRQGGTRPLNVRRRAGEALRLVLVDPEGIWAAGPPVMEVSLVV